MTHVHYKFSSKLSYDTVVFDGPHVTLRDLKKQIMGREKLRAGDCDLQITNAQSKEEYTDDECSIPKGSSVIVRRIPVIGSKSSKTRHVERSDVQSHQAFGAYKAMHDQSSSRALPLFSKMANLADVEGTEEDKIKVMINQSTYDAMNYNKKFGTVLPANYTCYRCGNTGHHIRNCPVSGDKNFEAPMRIKKSTGIPRSFMVEVDDPNTKGAMLTNCGRYAIPSIDIAAYAIGKKERPPFVPQEQPKSEEEEDPVPVELLCLICHNLLSDAVVIPCCGNSYCDDCIRTALLDSDEHVCPTCSQSEVSPDTLIANKFLRQAVDNFKKERGFTKIVKKGCGASQSQNPTPTPSPVPTPPPLSVQSQPQKPHLSTQQDPLRPRAQAADTPPPAQVCEAPPTATGPASSPPTPPSASLEPAESHLETPDKEDEEKTDEDSAAAAAAAPSVPVSPKDPTDAPSQPIPLVTFTPPVEPPTVSVNLEPPSSGPAPKPSGPSTWESSSSSSSLCPTGGWNEPNTQQLRPAISSYPSTPPPPLFPSPHFHTFLAAQQPLSSYPPGYPPPTPLWTLPNFQGAPIPSLCPSTAIPALIPKEWYQHQRTKKERSPHRGSSHRRSSSRSDSKSSKFKSSRSYSRSSSRSRSRSRSRSHGRSRPHSPYSRQRDLHSRSNSSRSYSFGYKRSPTPSSSSSPRVGYRSRPKSPSDHRKSSHHHSRHHGKKSASSSSGSRRRGEHHQREAAASGGSLPGPLYAPHANQSGSMEQDRERYLQWNRHYKEWCDKYFSSYVGHFHQLPLPLLNIPPPPQWGDGEGSVNLPRSHSDSRSRPPGRRAARAEGRSPPSRSSSDSRSPPSQSSRDSRSTLSQSSSDSRSSPTRSSNGSRSPPSRSSSDGRSTPSKDGAQPRAYQQKCTDKYNRVSVRLSKGGKEAELQESREDKKQVITKSLENLTTVKHEQKKKHEVGREEESSSPDAADSTDDCRKDKRRHSTQPKAFKDATPARDEAATSDALESVQPPTKPDKRSDKDYERKSREHRNLEMEKGRRRSKHSDSRQDAGRRHREKPSSSSKESDMVDADRYPGGSTASDSRSERSRKRKGEDTKRSSLKVENSKCPKTNAAEDPKTRKSESPDPFDRKKPKTEKKKERKPWPLTERDIWEGGIRVKPQKKISININLDGKKKEEKTEKFVFSYLEKTKEEIGAKEKLNKETDIEANEKKESSGDVEAVSEEKIKPDEGEARHKWEKATFRDDEGEKKDIGEKEDVDLWHSALREEEEETKESKQQRDERDGTEASKGEELTNDRRSVRGGEEGPAMGENTCKENRGNPPEESKEELMEGVKWRMWEDKEEDTVTSNSQRSRNESQRDGPDTSVDGGSSYEDRQEKKTEVKTLQELTEDRAADQQDEVIQEQVPHAKWEKAESEEEERDEGVTKAQTDAVASFLPSSSVSVTSETTANRETQNEEKRERSVERERQKTLSSSHRSVAPSSGKDRNDSAAYSGRDGERRRDRERGRESERPRERQKESKRSKERAREEEKGRDREREREHSSGGASARKRNPPSSSHSYSHSKSRDTERRDRQRGGDPGDTKSSPRISRKSSAGRSRESGAISRATELPDENTHRSCRDTLLDSTSKDKDQPHYSHNHPDPPENKRHQDRPAGTHHSPPEPTMSSPAPEVTQNRSRNESRVEKEEWKVRQVKKEGKGERVEEVVAVRGSRWEDEGPDRRTKWEAMRELEDGERTSSRSHSVSSSGSQENGRKEKKKKHNKEKRHAAPEPLEEEELKKHKTSKKSRDAREEKSGGEVEAGWREEEAQLCSASLS